MVFYVFLSRMHQMLDDLSRITIIGTGLLGGSVGLALRAKGFAGRIVGAGRRRETIDRACRCGCIDEGTTDLASAVAGAGLTLIAVPLSRFESTFEQLAGCVNEDDLISDLGSTKQNVMDLARRHLPRPQRFVGAHPMAGSEQQGPDAARADLFDGKPCIITPEPDTDPDALAVVEALWRSLGMKLLHMPARQHDQEAAVTSHLPHAAAVLLVQVAAHRGGWELASTGFGKTTRLASSNPPMRSDIMMANREAILVALEEMNDQVGRLKHLLTSSDEQALLEYLESAKDRRDEWINR